MLSCFSHVRLFVTLWTVACKAPLSMGFSRQEYWSVLPCPSPGDLPNLGVKPTSLMSPALAGGFFTTSATWEDLEIFSTKYSPQLQMVAEEYVAILEALYYSETHVSVGLNVPSVNHDTGFILEHKY